MEKAPISEEFNMDIDLSEEQELAILSGIVQSVMYANEENGYTVLKVQSENGATATVVGYMATVWPGQWMYAEGKWVNHPTHGTQFDADHCDFVMPQTKENLFTYLSSGAIKFVGASTAAQLINRFGENVLDVIENEPEKLSEIRGISPAKAEAISSDFRRQMHVRRLVEYLTSSGLRPVLAVRLYRYYGQSAMRRVQENPYILCTDAIGGTFNEADLFAESMGIEPDSMERVKAATLFELKYNLKNGHCFIPDGKLQQITSRIIRLDPERCQRGIEELIEEGEIIRESIGGVNACYLSDVYDAETYATERIYELSTNQLPILFDCDKIIHQVENRQNIKYTEEQREILHKAMENQIVVLTGGPGTGKTTSICAILAAYDRLGFDTRLAAPTGRAAKRMTELTGREAFTIHRLLGAKMGQEGDQAEFEYNEDNPLTCDAIIVDECSMVDLLLMTSLLRSLKDTCRIILVGDVDQLPSIGPGKVFADVINSDVVPTVRLQQVFRQKQESRIVNNAHLINKGEIPQIGENKGDFFRLQRINSSDCIETIVSLYTDRIPNNMNIPMEDIQVLTPTRKNETGILNLNRRLQESVNPADPTKEEKTFGDIIFREGDRVMQTRNNYDIMWSDSKGVESGEGVYNGDLGVIRTIDRGNKTVTVDFEGHLVKYDFEALDELEHAWAMTVHKSQGSEYRAVILALHTVSKPLMNRGLLYTAITRAKELLIIVGRDDVITTMIRTDRESRRYSGLRLRLLALRRAHE